MLHRMGFSVERPTLCTVGKPARMYNTVTWSLRVICAFGYTTSTFILTTVVRLVICPIPDAHIHYAVDDGQAGKTGVGVRSVQRVEAYGNQLTQLALDL